MSVARRLALLANNPVAIVGAIVLASFVMTTHYVLRVRDWRVMTDELLYVKLARSIADGVSLVPEVNGEYMAVFSQLFPLLFAPFVGLLSAPAAYEAGHVLNAFLMASTAVPVYLLVRAMALPRLAGYLVAALTVSVPWLGMATILWTEAVGYPTFAWAIFAIYRAISAPGSRNDLFVLGALALAFFARTQFIFLVGVLPLAILLHEVGYGARGRSVQETLRLLRRVVRSHRVLVVAYGVLALCGAWLAASRGLDEVLGTYEAAATGDLWPEGAWDQIWSHAASVTVAIGVIPSVLAMGWAVATVIRPSRRELHAFAVIVVLAVPALALVVASFVARFSLGGYLQDRYFFYAVPVLFAGMAACLLDSRRRWIGVAAAGIGFYLIADYHAYDEQSRKLWFAAPSTWFWKVLEGRSGQLGAAVGIDGLSPLAVIEVGTLIVSATLAALIRWRPPTRTLLVGVALPVLLFCFVETNYVLSRGTKVGGGGFVVNHGSPLDDRDWVDEALPPDADAAIVPTWVGDDLATSRGTWWEVEFWNKHVTNQVVTTGAYTPFPRQRMSVDFATGRVALDGEEPSYLVVARTSPRFQLFKKRSLARGLSYLELIEPRRPYRAAWTTAGIPADGWTMREPVRIRLHHDVSDEREARRVTLKLSAIAVPGLRPYRIRGGVHEASGTLITGEVREVAVTACLPPRESAEIELDVRRQGRIEDDDRRLGLRVLQIDAVPTSTDACWPRSA